MSDSPSKFPDLQEIGKMAYKFLSDVKQSVTEIMADYKEKHRQDDLDNQDDITETKPRASRKKKSSSDEEGE